MSALVYNLKEKGLEQANWKNDSKRVIAETIEPKPYDFQSYS